MSIILTFLVQKIAAQTMEVVIVMAAVKELKVPKSLSPCVLKCDLCKSLVGYNAPTDSYYLIKASKHTIKNCNFCMSLYNCAIPERVGMVILD